jgi:hypothetical protein
MPAAARIALPVISVTTGDLDSPRNSSDSSQSAPAGGRGALHRVAFGESIS